jgi:hypothetical protein
MDKNDQKCNWISSKAWMRELVIVQKRASKGSSYHQLSAAELQQ